MAYIPPFKRNNLKQPNRSSPSTPPFPSSLTQRFNESLNLGPFRRRRDRYGAGKIVFAEDSIYRWWAIGAASDADLIIPSSFCLEPFDNEIVERRDGEKPLVIVRSGALDNAIAERKDIAPWILIAERLVQDLIVAAASARGRLIREEEDEVKLYFNARFGKILFHGGSSLNIDSIRKAESSQHDSGNKLDRTFYTDVPSSYWENIKASVAPDNGFTFHWDKERYHIKVSDKRRPRITITCKCTVSERGRLDLCKIEENPVRHLVEDISCLYKDLDLRFLLVTTRITRITLNEKDDALINLVRSAVIDPGVRGGLRWPRGKNWSGGRFAVVGAWHTQDASWQNETMKLKLRRADRFDHRKSLANVSTEVTLKLAKISRFLEEKKIESNKLKEMVQDAVKFSWDHLLSLQ